jgi:hypothetical protein
MSRSSRRIPVALAVIIGLAGCSSTKLVNRWENPQYVPAQFQRLLVIGVSQQASLRRIFEDEFAARLKAEGVDAVPSYQFIPEDGQVDEARLQQAVRQAGADGVLMTRLVRVERKTQVTPGYYDPGPGMGLGLYPWYSAGWLGYYEPPRVYQYDVYISETSLYDARRNQLVWSGTVQTTEPGNLDKEIRRYVTTIVKALKKDNVLVAATQG